MAIVLLCPQCGTRSGVADEHAGRKARCPKCSAVLDVPRAGPPAAEDLPEVVPVGEGGFPDVLPVTEAPAAGIAASPAPPRPPAAPARARPAPDRPRQRPAPVAKASRGGMPVLLIVGLIAGVLLLPCGLAVGVVAYGVYAFQSQREAEELAAAEERARADQARAAARAAVGKGGVPWDNGKQQAVPEWRPPPVMKEDPQEAARRAEELRRQAEDARRLQEKLAEDARLEAARQEEERRQAMARLEEARRQAEARQAEEEARKKADQARDRLARLQKPLAEVTIPAAVEGAPLPALTRNPGTGLTWTDLPLGTAGGPRTRPGSDQFRSSPAAGACWAADGGSFFALTRAGVLRRIAYPDLKELRSVDFKQECHALATCKYGLLLTLGQLQELWVVNPDTLAVVKRFGVAQVLRALTGPDLGVAYVFCNEGDGFQNAAAGQPLRISLEDGTLTALTLARDPAANRAYGGFGFAFAALSPDGRWLFADGGYLVRYRIEDSVLTMDAVSHAGMGGGHKEGICVSPDNQWVAFPTGGGNDGLTVYGSYVYRAADLSRPAFTLHQGAYPEIVGYDVAGKRIFSQNYDHPLIVFDQNGTRRGEHKFGKIGGSHNVKQYAAHPKDGRGLLLRTHENLLLIEFTRAD